MDPILHFIEISSGIIDPTLGSPPMLDWESGDRITNTKLPAGTLWYFAIRRDLVTSYLAIRTKRTSFY